VVARRYEAIWLLHRLRHSEFKNQSGCGRRTLQAVAKNKAGIVFETGLEGLEARPKTRPKRDGVGPFPWCADGSRHLMPSRRKGSGRA